MVEVSVEHVGDRGLNGEPMIYDGVSFNVTSMKNTKFWCIYIRNFKGLHKDTRMYVQQDPNTKEFEIYIVGHEVNGGTSFVPYNKLKKK